MRNISWVILATALGVALPGAASATPITYDFSSVTNAGGPYASLTFGALKVTALDASNVATTITGQGTGVGGFGLGVTGGASPNLVDPGDSLIFSFSPLSGILLSSIIFESNTPPAAPPGNSTPAYFNLAVDGVSKITNQSVGGDPANNLFAVTFNGVSGYLGSTFTIQGGTGGAFRVQKITVDIIPEPTSLLLLGTGLGALGLAAWRRKK